MAKTAKKDDKEKQDDGEQKLFKAVERSYKDWEAFRKVNYKLVEEYAGDGYGPSSSSEGQRRETILNLLHQTVSAYMMALAANTPKVLVETRSRKLRGFARHFELALNNLTYDIGLVHTIRRWVLDSYFMIGITKVHMKDSGFVQIEQDIMADPGFPFASNVSMDNFVVDTTARRWGEVWFIGDVYRIPFEDLQDDTIWDQEAVKDVRPSSKSENAYERLENIGRGYETDQDEFVSMVDLIDLWMPREGKVVTYACDFRNGSMKPYGKRLAELPWTGSELGPYEILGFDEVPESLMPVGPATHLSPLAKHINNIYRKQIRRARNLKENPTYTPGAEKSARNLLTSSDGDHICVQDNQELSAIRTGGVDQENQMFMLNMMDHFNSLAGNVQAMIGLSPQADTLGQERMIQGAVSGVVAQMANRVNECVTSLITNLARLLWDDEVNTIRGEMKLPGLDGYSAQSDWIPGDREGEFTDYQISIDIFSMPYKSASDKASSILQLVSQVYVPLSDQLMAQGGTIDMRELNDMLADLMDQPRLKEIIRFTTPISPAPASSEGGSRGGGPTTREYVRRSAGSGDKGRSVSQQQAWASLPGKSQQ
jgi:hypothetical protein